MTETTTVITEPRTAFAAAWTTALAAMSDVIKDHTVKTGSYSYTYADLKSVLQQSREVLSQYGLAVQQTAFTVDGQPAVTTIVWHRDGHSERFGPLVIPAQANAQQIGSAITYARRYQLMAVLGMATEDDDGAAASMPEPAKPIREEPPFNGEQWLKDAAGAFAKWKAADRKSAWVEAVKDIAPSKPMTKAEAEKVYAHMAAAYYAQFDESLF